MLVLRIAIIVRLLGIGRNQFIDTMNQCRQKVRGLIEGGPMGHSNRMHHVDMAVDNQEEHHSEVKTLKWSTGGRYAWL